MLYVDGNYIFQIALFGRRNSGKSQFMQMMMDRNDISIVDIYENGDCFRVNYKKDGLGQFTLYNFNGFVNDMAYISAINTQLASFMKQIDYVVYFVESVQAVNDFDRRFISVLLDQEPTVLCVLNKSAREQVNMVHVYTRQAELGVPVYVCECAIRADVTRVSDELELLAKEDINLDNVKRFFMEDAKNVVFVLPITMAGHHRNKDAKYFDLLKTVSDHSGAAVCVNRQTVKDFIKHTAFKPNAVVIGDKLLLNVRDIDSLI